MDLSNAGLAACSGHDRLDSAARRTRRSLGEAAAGLAGALALAACGSGGEASAPQGAPQRAPVTVQLGYRPDPEDQQILKDDFLPRFEAANPTIKVEIMTITGSYPDQVITLYTGGTPPDLLWVNHPLFPGWAAKGMLHSVEPLAKRDSRRLKLDDFYPTMLEATRFKGQLYGLPYLGGIYIVTFNRRQFRAADQPLPSDLAQQGKWTVAAFLDAARRLTAGAPGSTTVFGTNYTLDFTTSAPWLWGDGAGFFNADRTAFATDTPAAQAALQFQADLIHKYHVAAGPGETAAGGAKVNFLAENQAMDVGWSTGTRNYLPHPDVDWDAAPMPKGSVRSESMYGYNPLSIMTPSKQVDAAWELIGHLTGPYVVQTWTERGRIMATRKSAAQQAKFLDALPPAYQRLARDGAQTSRAEPNVVAHDNIARAVNPLLLAIAKGEQNARDAALEMKRLADPLLAAQ